MLVVFFFFVVVYIIMISTWGDYVLPYRNPPPFKKPTLFGLLNTLKLPQKFTVWLEEAGTRALCTFVIAMWLFLPSGISILPQYSH